MTKEEIRRLLAEDNLEVLQAHNNIVAVQKDKSHLIKFGMDWLDNNLIGGLNNKMIFLGSRPGGGKTYHCSRTINNLLNKSINPMPIKVLRLNLEMPTEALLLRELSKALGKKPSEILKTEYTAEEQVKVKKVVAAFRDSRIQNFSHTLKGEDFRFMLEEFLGKVDAEDVKRNDGVKTKKVILTDHIHVYLSKEVIDTILTIQNELKMRDPNLSFINYFQLNREVENLWRETKDKKVNPKNMLPSSIYIYMSDMLQMYADVVASMVIPQVYDMDEYAAIHKERHPHLEAHFSEDMADDNYARLKGRNRIYYNFMKIRMLDDFDDPRLFCEVLNPAHEEKASKIMKENKMPSLSAPKFDVPVFENPNKGVVPNFDLSSAFETPNSSADLEDAPF